MHWKDTSRVEEIGLVDELNGRNEKGAGVMNNS